MGPMFKEFRQFILRGNLVDLAVAVVIGAAFTAVVKAIVADLITPLIGAIGGKHDFSTLSFTINHSKFAYGDFLNELVTFVIVAFVVFYFVIRPVNALLNLLKAETPTEHPTRECPKCLSQIPAGATRCMFCTSEVAASTT
jgi:large conductance mechanosensitive channel